MSQNLLHFCIYFSTGQFAQRLLADSDVPNLGTFDKNARNGSRKKTEKTQDKDERMTSQIVRYVCYYGTSKLAEWRSLRTGIQKHLGSHINNNFLAERSIFVGRKVHIYWPKRP